METTVVWGMSFGCERSYWVTRVDWYIGLPGVIRVVRVVNRIILGSLGFGI